MAKHIVQEHLSYCAGKGWVGDGTKENSPCPFGNSQRITASRYICHHCATGIKPSSVIADGNGLTEYGRSITPQPFVPETQTEESTDQKASLHDLPALDEDIPGDVPTSPHVPKKVRKKVRRK